MVSSFAASSVHSTLITMPTPSPADQYWELTTSTITHGGETLHRIRATRAIPEQGACRYPRTRFRDSFPHG